MQRDLTISIGQYSDKGRKAINQDFHGAIIPENPLLGLKGIAIVLADGISSSNVSQIASESAVKSFLTDYYCTSETWSVKTSAQRVIAATNSWLYAQTRQSDFRYDKDKGFVCTLSAIVLKSNTAHLFHIGDCRIYRLAEASLEQLTEDHRVKISEEQTYLGRALGINSQIEIDYRAIEVQPGDVLVLATDGVYEHINRRAIAAILTGQGNDLDAAARAIVTQAYDNGSTDNLTVQIVRIDALPQVGAGDMPEQGSDLPLPPLLEARQRFDGYRVVRELHASSRSHIYLAIDEETNERVALKIPSLDLRDDPDYLRRFKMEEWVARRLDSPHVLKPRPPSRRRNYLYIVSEFVDGQTLTQWMRDNPTPSLETVRGLAEQIAKGLRAFHRKEMLHQDLRPENILIDATGTVKIIDFGSTKVAGVAELARPDEQDALGTVQYMAPEYLLGETGTPRSDLFSLGVIVYQMLCGALPYGTKVAQARNKAQQRKLRYRLVTEAGGVVPMWVDGALRRAVQVDPNKRYEALSEFLYDLRHPNAAYLHNDHAPLLHRNPLLFWKGLCLALIVVIAVLLARQQGLR